MSPDENRDKSTRKPGRAGVSRRRLLRDAAAAGLTLGALEPVGAVASPHYSPAPPLPGRRRRGSDLGSAPPITGLHLQFGADASSEVAVTWQTYAPIENPRVEVGTIEHGPVRGPTWATTRGYQDPRQPDESVYVHSTLLDGLDADTEYVYLAAHDGADAEVGDFRTAPRGRAAFTFTSYGDQGTPTVTAPTELASPAPPYFNDNLGSPAAGDVTAGVEKIAPLFHLVNGDLCYANLSSVPVRTWSDWFASNSRSARFRPWMPTAGNHENEGIGPNGFQAYQTYFDLPSNGGPESTDGLWYSFQVGSVKVIALNNDDVCLQDRGSIYVHGYSGGAQKRWLESELAATRRDRSVDWIVVCMHQVAMSTAQPPKANGADIGIRREWMPLFDRYGVDLVVCGHEHHYERTQPVRGTTGSETLTPQPVPASQQVIDTSRGTVHMVIGGGGTSVPSNQLLTEPPVCGVITSVGPEREAGRGSLQGGFLVSHYTQEEAIWSSVRDRDHPYGFAAFAVDPGRHRGGKTSIEVTYYRVVGFGGELEAYDSFTLVRPRRDR